MGDVLNGLKVGNRPGLLATTYMFSLQVCNFWLALCRYWCGVGCFLLS